MSRHGGAHVATRAALGTPAIRACLRTRKGACHGASENVGECQEAAVGQMASACARPAHCVDDLTRYLRNEGRRRPCVSDRPRRSDERCVDRSGSWAATDRRLRARLALGSRTAAAKNPRALRGPLAAPHLADPRRRRVGEPDPLHGEDLVLGTAEAASPGAFDGGEGVPPPACDPRHRDRRRAHREEPLRDRRRRRRTRARSGR